MASRCQRVSIVGTGRIAFLLEEDKLRYKPCTHMGAVRALTRKYALEWDAICDLDKARSQAAADFVGSDALLTHDYREVISRRPDVLIIACDTSAHFQVISSAVKAGIPAVVAEKPIVQSRKHARQLRKICAASATKVWLNYERRYHPKYLRLREALSRGKYGRIISYSGQLALRDTSFLPTNDSEGMLLHDVTHLLDLVFFLIGPPRSVSSDKGAIDVHRLKINHGKPGPEGFITSIKRAPFFHIELEILCEEARIRVGNGFLSVEKVADSKHYGFRGLAPPRISPDQKITAKNNPFIRLYHDVFNRKNNGNEVALATANVMALLANRRQVISIG